jgi:SAM-dependent methyltransferase
MKITHSITLVFKIVNLLLCVLTIPLWGESSQDAFTRIYKSGLWGKNNAGEGTSGEGSSLLTTESYRTFLQQFLKEMHIHSVVDAGCGDWEFSRAIKWDGIDYKGYDVVKSVIKKNKAKFSRSNIQFYHVDLLQTELPTADLLLCKDVLQHLTIEDVLLFIKQLPKFKYCLITNDVYPTTLSSHNPQIARGDYRPLDLTQPPFLFSLQQYPFSLHKVLTYDGGGGVTKQALLIINNQLAN